MFRFDADAVAPQESYGKQGGSYMQQNLQLEDGMDDVDVAIIADRNRDIQQLDRDMEELAEVYQVRRERAGGKGESALTASCRR